MDGKKEVSNKCLLVNYVEDYDGKKLVICRSRGSKDPIIHTWNGEKAKQLYLKTLELVSFGKISKEDCKE